MAIVPNMMIPDVADLEEIEIQTSTQKLEKTRNEKEMFNRKTSTLTLMN